MVLVGMKQGGERMVVALLNMCQKNLGLSINHSIFILFVSSISMILPGMPGNFGTFEGSVIYSFILFGNYGIYNITDDFGFAFILHLVSFIPYTIFGFIYFITELKFFTNKKFN